MFRLVLIMLVTGSVLAPVALAQTATGTQTDATDLTTGTPMDNAGGGRVSARAPGKWVQAAITRHNNLTKARLRGPRFGESNTTEAELRFGDSSTTGSGTTGSGGLTDLLNLANQFLGGGASDLSGLLGGLTGSGTTTTGTSSSSSGTATSSSGTTIPPPLNGTSYTLEDLLALAQQYGGTQKTNNAGVKTSTTAQTQDSSSTGRTIAGRTFGGAIARLPKPEQRYQSITDLTEVGSNGTTTAEQSFRVRWTNAMLQTFFSAASVALQSSEFVTILQNFLEDTFGPLFCPQDDTEDDGSAAKWHDGGLVLALAGVGAPGVSPSGSVGGTASG